MDYDPLSAESKQDPDAYWRVLRETEPVHHYVLEAEAAQRISANPLASRSTPEFWSVLRHADVLSVLDDPRTFSSVDGPGPEWMTPLIEGGALLFADDPQHLRQRRLVARAFTPRAVEKLAPQIQTTIDALIDKVADRGSMEILEDLSLPLAIRTIAAIIGLPEERDADFRRWGNAIVGAFGGDVTKLEAGFGALNELFAYLQSLIDGIRAGQDSTSEGGILVGLVSAEVEGTQLSDEEIRLVCMQLITAGFETTSTATASAVHLLCSHPDQRAAFEADPAAVAPAVEEVLRHASPLEGLFRTTAMDTEISGCPVPKGSKVRVVFASANRDAAQFSDPQEFRIDRPEAELRSHLAFGFGPHACIGAALARSELRSVLHTLFRRLPGLELDASKPAVRSTALTINGFSEVNIRWDPTKALPAGGQVALGGARSGA